MFPIRFSPAFTEKPSFTARRFFGKCGRESHCCISCMFPIRFSPAFTEKPARGERWFCGSGGCSPAAVGSLPNAGLCNYLDNANDHDEHLVCFKNSSRYMLRGTRHRDDHSSRACDILRGLQSKRRRDQSLSPRETLG